MDCNSEFSYENETECPNCHSKNLNVRLNIFEKIQVSTKEEKINYFGKNPLLKGKAKIRQEGKIERQTSKKTKTGYAVVERQINREDDRYFEKVSDEDGNIIHFCDEKLSEHQGHGSAKNKK